MNSSGDDNDDHLYEQPQAAPKQGQRPGERRAPRVAQTTAKHRSSRRRPVARWAAAIGIAIAFTSIAAVASSQRESATPEVADPDRRWQTQTVVTVLEPCPAARRARRRTSEGERSPARRAAARENARSLSSALTP